MDGDLGDLKEAKSPDAFLSSLERKIETTLTRDFWSIKLPADLETSAALAPQLLAFRAAQVLLSAPVLFSDKKVRDLLDPTLRPPTKSVEQHHLFPRAWLKATGHHNIQTHQSGRKPNLAGMAQKPGSERPAPI